MTSKNISIKVKIPNSQMVTKIVGMLKEQATILEQINQALFKSPDISQKIETLTEQNTVLEQLNNYVFNLPTKEAIKKYQADDLSKLVIALGNLTVALTNLKNGINISKNSFALTNLKNGINISKNSFH